jgi:hypothetical protein
MIIHKFAIVVDGDVAGTISIDDANTSESARRHIAAYNSDPKIIPVPSDIAVAYGWTYEDGVFVSPPVADTGSGESEVE